MMKFIVARTYNLWWNPCHTVFVLVEGSNSRMIEDENVILEKVNNIC